MNGSNSVSIVILDLDATTENEIMFVRDWLLKETLKGNTFKVAVWS